MINIKNDLLLRALRGEEVSRVPVWLMRQAGRYLPEYRAVRAHTDFFSMVQNPQLACEVTLQPVRRLGVDAAIIFSDILVIPQALGLEVLMDEGKGPSFPTPIAHPSDLGRLREPEVSRDLSYVGEAIQLTVERLAGEVPLIGFCGAPWTVFAYMTGASGIKSFQKAKTFLFNYPDAAHELLRHISAVSAKYLHLQIEHGASAIQIFDSWAGELSPEDYRCFGIPYLASLIAAIPKSTPVIIFAKGAHFALEELSTIGASCLALDWTLTPREARTRVPELALQGNLDPCVLYAPIPEIIRRTQAMLAGFGKRGYIANLGHGVLPDIDPQRVHTFVRTVQEYQWET